MKEFQGLHVSLSFEDLENIQFQGLLEDWWCYGCLGLKIRVIERILCNRNNCKQFSTIVEVLDR